MKMKSPDSKLPEGQEWMQTQTYHHPFQHTLRTNAFYLFTEAHWEFKNVDFGCEKRDECKIEHTVPFKRKSPQAFKGGQLFWLIKKNMHRLQPPDKETILGSTNSPLPKYLLHHHMASKGSWGSIRWFLLYPTLSPPPQDSLGSVET